MGQGWRTHPLPPDWPTIRAGILHRDKARCHACGQGGATEVDHIVPASQGGTDHPTNLAPIHTICHRTKTAREARAAQPQRKRPPEQHPGLI